MACAWVWACAPTPRCACVPSPTSALVAGGSGHECELLETLYCEAFLGYPKLRWPLPLSTSPLEGSFYTRGNRRGPVWPVIAWPSWWSLRRAGDKERAETLAALPRRRSPRGGRRVLRAPYIGEDLGSDDQPWTSAVTPDWLVDGV